MSSIQAEVVSVSRTHSAKFVVVFPMSTLKNVSSERHRYPGSTAGTWVRVSPRLEAKLKCKSISLEDFWLHVGNFRPLVARRSRCGMGGDLLALAVGSAEQWLPAFFGPACREISGKPKGVYIHSDVGARPVVGSKPKLELNL
jgi:hypothetical protein